MLFDQPLEVQIEAAVKSGADRVQLVSAEDYIPQSIRNLTAARELFLIFNCVQELPPEIGELVQLEKLSIFGTPILTIPTWIKHLTNLRFLRIEECLKVQSLPEEIGCLSRLEELVVADNDLGQLPESIGKLTNLRRLDASANRKLTSLPDSLQQLSKLRTLDLRVNRLKSLPPWLRHLPELQVLLLQDNKDLQLPLDVLGPADAPANPKEILDFYFEAHPER